jgi:hypothetical protein
MSNVQFRTTFFRFRTQGNIGETSAQRVDIHCLIPKQTIRVHDPMASVVKGRSRDAHRNSSTDLATCGRKGPE